MITTPEQVDLWRKSPSEHQRLEFKEAKTQFDNQKLFTILGLILFKATAMKKMMDDLIREKSTKCLFKRLPWRPRMRLSKPAP